jgi:hypothetical protein
MARAIRIKNSSADFDVFAALCDSLADRINGAPRHRHASEADQSTFLSQSTQLDIAGRLPW